MQTLMQTLMQPYANVDANVDVNADLCSHNVDVNADLCSHNVDVDATRWRWRWCNSMTLMQLDDVNVDATRCNFVNVDAGSSSVQGREAGRVYIVFGGVTGSARVYEVELHVDASLGTPQPSTSSMHQRQRHCRTARRTSVGLSCRTSLTLTEVYSDERWCIRWRHRSMLLVDASAKLTPQGKIG